MMGERGASEASGVSQLAHRHALVASLHQQAEQGQAMFLGQSAQAGARVIGFHISTSMEIMVTVKLRQ